MAGEATPTDGRFRRGVYVMLVVLGMLAAGGLIDQRRSGPETTAAKQAARAAQADAAMARKQLADVQAAQAKESRAAADREARAVAQREAANAKLDALERFTVALLAASGTPEQRRAYAAIVVSSPGPQPAPTPSGSPSPRATSSPRPPPRSPSPSPTCRLPLPLLGCP